MPVHPKAEEMIATIDAMGYSDIIFLEPPQAREEEKRVTVPFLTRSEPVEKIENHLVKEGSDEIPVRIYWPKLSSDQADTELYPIIVFFHGGGWVCGSLDLYDELCSMLCNKSASIVVSVDYRLAPESKFPKPLEDCYSAAKWVSSHAENLGGDRDSIVVAGDSAGGNLAAAVCLMAKNRGEPEISMQVLIYPITDLSWNLSKFSHYKYGCSKEYMDWIIKHYVRTSADLKEPLASPIVGNLTGLPPAIIISAEYDSLRDQDLAFAKKLEQSGVKTQVLDYPGMVHGFVQLPGFFADGREAIEKISFEISKMYVENPS